MEALSFSYLTSVADDNRVNPLNILLSCVLPLYAEDARDMVVKIIQQAQERGTEIPIEDGFDLYRGLAAARRLYADALPEYDTDWTFPN
jgi:hypothetical protein